VERREELRLSIAQIETKLNDKAFNLGKISYFLKKAKEEQSDLVVFPELCVTGYLIGPWLREAAEKKDGPSIRFIQKLCNELEISTIISFPEIYNDQYYVTAAYINNQGEVLGFYRKTHLYDQEAIYFSHGEKVPVFQTEFGNIGIMGCFDIEFPEVARILRLKGADIILIPTSNMAPYKEYQRIYTQCRAMENEVPLALCNRIGTEGDLTFIGGSTFIDARGETHILLTEKEELITQSVLLFKSTDSKLSKVLNNNENLYRELTL